MATLSTRQATKWVKCAACAEMITTMKKYIQVVGINGKDVRGERYCVGCEKYARLNNDITDINVQDDERHLREREDYAAYQAAGCTAAYWTDRDSGKVGQ
jgi:hypothetical protein